MSTRLFIFSFAAFALCALGACSSEPTGSSSTTGSGGSGGGGVGGSGGSGGSGGGATSSTGTGTASTGTGTACDDQLTCAAAIGGDPSKLCEGPSAELYDAYYACTCETGGKCFTVCEKANCAGTQSGDCTKCLQASDTGCSKEFEACSGDI